MIRILKNLRAKDWGLVFIIILLVFAQVWLDLKMPEYVSEITKLVQTEGSKMSDIMSNGGMMLLCTFASLLGAVATGYSASLLSANLSMNIRSRLFNKVENLSMAEIKKFSTSSLITRTTNDITQIQMFAAMGFQMLIKAPLTAILAIMKITDKSWQWSALTGVCVVILLSVIAVLILIVLPRFKKVQKLTDKLNGVTRENLTGIRVIRAFNAESFQQEKFDNVNDELTGQQLFNQKTFAIMQPVMYLIMYGLSLGIYFIGANLIDGAVAAERMSLFGDMIVFSSYAMQIIGAFLMLALIFMILPRASVSANRINEVIYTENSIKNGKVKKGIDGEEGTVEFKDVFFRYPDGDEDLLRNINFKINKGETFAIVGSTGSGKSSVINLIPRLYDATGGEVLVDGVNVKEYDEEYLNSKIGFVTQKAILFNGTVNSNVSYGKSTNGKVTKEKVKEAIKVAQAKDFVEKMEKGYDGFIASSGTNISGGQKQRISIARAIARDPEIFVFDDSFSALDYKTDSLLRKELKKYTKNATTIIVAQRIGTIMHADKIMVLDEGKIVGLGTHKELLKSCEVYKQIALSQLSKEELENE
ncbi:MAG: ABC transporter ATP-binding protein [Bacilli bacterium]|nr:ABC transporter ATP-binding protein [Bacilli bacterium]